MTKQDYLEKFFKVEITAMKEDIVSIRDSIKELENLKYVPETIKRVEKTLNSMEKKFVLRSEFVLVRTLVYGLAGTALLAVANAVLSFVVSRGG